eukprot:TRINITY_DN27060_c0_g1_i1.p1 TRINITY_DN27060_c0_g1~~TRINITY_DN27060_c0_g1_i1.p1  ORF type:complete len:270 (+),score=42.01 TRINITY_DN27060_c0_g1_i1:63-872(+)
MAPGPGCLGRSFVMSFRSSRRQPTTLSGGVSLKTVPRRSLLGLVGLLVGLLLYSAAPTSRRPSGNAFFEFLGKPPKPSAEAAESPASSYATGKQLKVLRILQHQSSEIATKWQAYREEQKIEVLEKCPQETLKSFLEDPGNHNNDFLKGFMEKEKLEPVTVPSYLDNDVEDDDFGGFMDSNSFGLVKSDKWYAAERELMAERISTFLQSSKMAPVSWSSYCRKLESWEDPDDSDSEEIRAKMSMTTELGRKLTPLEAWNEINSGNGPHL